MEISFDRATGRIEATPPGSGERAFLVMKMDEQNWTLLYTEVPKAFAGQGIGSKLVQRALDEARSAGVLVKPLCPFTAAYLKRHPEETPLVHPDYLHLVER